MEITPVTRIKTPLYPKKQDVSPKMLQAVVPRRWKASAAVRITLGALTLMSLTACDRFYGATDGVPAPPPTPTPTIIDDVLAGIPLPPTLDVAPLFIHGEGRGAYGCVMIAPPVFLCEAEAMEIINDVAREYGLEFSHDAPALSNVKQPAVEVYTEDGQKPDKIWMTLVPDFADSKNGIVIEFVSAEDVENWKQQQTATLPEPHVEISAGTYDMRDAAAQLSRALEDADMPYDEYAAGVLYDPCASADFEGFLESDEQTEDYIAQSRAMSAAQLEKQARDLFEWLKTQGII